MTRPPYGLVLRLTYLKIPLAMRIMIFCSCFPNYRHVICSRNIDLFAIGARHEVHQVHTLDSRVSPCLASPPSLRREPGRWKRIQATAPICSLKTTAAVGSPEWSGSLRAASAWDRRLVSPNRVRIISQEVSKATRGLASSFTYNLYFILHLLPCVDTL